MKLQTRGDAFFVGSIIGPEIAGIYGITVRAQETLMYLIAQIGGALSPSMAHLFGSRNKERFKQVVSRLFIIIMVVGTVGFAAVVAMNESFIGLWVGAELYGGTAVTVLFAVAGLLSVAGYVFYDGLISSGNFAYLSKSFMASGIIHLSMLVLLLPLGLWGAPVAAMVSSSLWGTLFARRVMNSLNFRSEDRRTFTRTICTASFCFALAVLAASKIHVESWISFSVMTLSVVLVTAGVFLLIQKEARSVIADELSTIIKKRIGGE